MSTEKGPNVYAIPPGADFSRSFATGFYERFGAATPDLRARTHIFVNTSRTLRAIEDALLMTAPRSDFLPRMGLITDFAANIGATPDLKPPINPMRRHLHLTGLVERFLATAGRSGETVAPISAAPDLAASLALLIDQVNDAGIAFEALDAVAAAEAMSDGQARHWDRMMVFLDIIRRAWPELKSELEGGALDPRERQRAAIDAQIEAWRGNPPDAPVIAAGSTGSVGSTAELLAAIAQLDQGLIVLPGFDPEVDQEIWLAAGPDHPFGPFKEVLARLDIGPRDVAQWCGSAPSPRRAFFNQAMRPAPVTDHWFDSAAKISAICADATSELTLIEADTPDGEAAAIAVAIREAIETPHRTVALVTPDAALARRVTAELDRFGIEPDDSLGKPLAQSPPGVLLRLTIDVASGRAADVDLVAMLTHPLVQAGHGRTEHLKFSRAYELAVLRGATGHAPDQILPQWQRATEEQQAWHDRVTAILTPLAGALSSETPLDVVLERHRSVLVGLTTGTEDAPPSLWDGNAGVAMRSFLERLEMAAPAFGLVKPGTYQPLLDSLIRGEQIRSDPSRPHPRVAIWGPREARVLNADLIIAAGLNDGVWPGTPDPDPWLSRPMRTVVGLPLPEAQIGLSAHDFLQSVCRPAVILSRSKKVDGSPTVASRWLTRLENLIAGIGCEDQWKAMCRRGERYTALARMIEMPQTMHQRATRPQATPPVSARPRQLSVTELETLVRDAYAVYAKRVLKLRPLDPLDRPADARDRGIVIHRILEEFARHTDPWPGDAAAREVLLSWTATILRNEIPWPDLRRIWHARLQRAADWLIGEEAENRRAGRIAALEVAGKLSMDLPGGDFLLTAKADRIDRIGANGGTVLDYKSGHPPTKDQIAAGLNHQLHMQGAILEAGGFENVSSLRAETGQFLGLTGAATGGVKVSIDELSDQIAEHLNHVIDLLSAYDAGASYISRGRIERTDWEGDYDHLARRQEWEDDG